MPSSIIFSQQYQKKESNNIFFYTIIKRSKATIIFSHKRTKATMVTSSFVVEFYSQLSSVSGRLSDYIHRTGLNHHDLQSKLASTINFITKGKSIQAFQNLQYVVATMDAEDTNPTTTASTSPNSSAPTNNESHTLLLEIHESNESTHVKDIPKANESTKSKYNPATTTKPFKKKIEGLETMRSDVIRGYKKRKKWHTGFTGRKFKGKKKTNNETVVYYDENPPTLPETGAQIDGELELESDTESEDDLNEELDDENPEGLDKLIKKHTWIPTPKIGEHNSTYWERIKDGESRVLVEDEDRCLISNFYRIALGAPGPAEWCGRGGKICEILAALNFGHDKRRKVKRVVSDTYRCIYSDGSFDSSFKAKGGKPVIIQRNSQEERDIADYMEKGVSLRDVTRILNENKLQENGGDLESSGWFTKSAVEGALSRMNKIAVPMKRRAQGSTDKDSDWAKARYRFVTQMLVCMGKDPDLSKFKNEDGSLPDCFNK